MRRKKVVCRYSTGIIIGLIFGIGLGYIGFHIWKSYQPSSEPLTISGPQREELSKQNEVQEKKEIPRPQISRQEVMEYATKNISALSPVEPVLGGKWHIINFWFDDDYNFYVDYEDGHILRRLLVSVEGKTENPEYKIIGYFESGENQMVLKEGEDILSDKDYKDLDLYWWDEEKENWTKLN